MRPGNDIALNVLELRLRLFDGELLVSARLLKRVLAGCDATKSAARRHGFDIGIEQLCGRVEVMRDNSLDELACAGASHRRNLVPTNAIFKRAPAGMPVHGSERTVVPCRLALVRAACATVMGRAAGSGWLPDKEGFLIKIVMCLAACAAVVAVLVPAATGASGRATLSGSVPPWAAAANWKSSADASSSVNFRVYLGWRDASAAAALAQAVSTPGSA